MYLVLGFLLVAFGAVPINGTQTSELEYCSSQNTGSSSPPSGNIYQSVGSCTTHCHGFAFGILQGDRCWCSNIAPAPETNTDVSNCGTKCPGYPPDPCGNPAEGLFGYIQMKGQAPMGTASISSSMTTTPPRTTTAEIITTETTATETTATETTVAETTSSSSSTDSVTETVETVTVTASNTRVLSPVTASGTSHSSPMTSAMTTSTGSHTVSIQTVNGKPTTVTIIGQPDSTSPPNSSTSSSSSGSSGSSSIDGGTIAGIVIGSVGGCAAVAAAIFIILVLRRRRRSDNQDQSFQNSLVEGDRNGKSPQMGFVRNMFSDNHNQSTSAGSSNARNQTFTDNRMKTDTMLYTNPDRDSSVSLQDNEDYSRPVLRLTNPD